MVQLYAGELCMDYENGFIRCLRSGDREIIRMIYFALRDEHWQTYPIRIENERIERDSVSFFIRYQAHHISVLDPVVQWDVTIEGRADGSVSMEIHGEVKREFRKNRAGCCVLHPVAESKGMPVEITHDDGTVEDSFFPELISPVSPFTNIRSMRFTNGSSTYQLRFEGDIFETEDQRNWTDASFKTFCTPLGLPFPVTISTGEKIYQKVMFKPVQVPSASPASQKIEINITSKDYPLPDIGVGSSTGDLSTPGLIPLVRSLNLSHYRIDVVFSRQDWFSVYLDQLAFSLRCELPVELALHCGENDHQMVSLLINHGSRPPYGIKKIEIFPDTAPLVAGIAGVYADAIKSAWPAIPVGVGTDYNFAELNRERPDARAVDFVTFAIQPQEHAFDDRTLIENISAQSEAIETAHSLYPGKEIHVSPVTLRRRYNPYATEETRKVMTPEERADPRQQSAFLAVWTLGSIKRISESGSRSVTFFELTGDAGVISGDAKPFPVYDSIREITRRKGVSVIGSISTRPLIAEAILFTDSTGVIWNYTGQPVELLLQHRRYMVAPFQFRIIAF